VAVGQREVFESVPSAPARSSQSVVERALRWNIGTGAWRPGEAIPSERELAHELGVGRTTLRSAIAVLRAEGLLVTSIGRSGSTRLAESGTAAGRAEVRRDILHHFEFRCVVEPEAAGLAAERGTTRDFDRLRDLIQGAPADLGSYRAVYSQFHIGIAEATGNPLLTKAIAELCVEFSTWSRIPEDDHAFAATHRPIYDGLMTRDAADARDQMKAHLVATRDCYLELVD
jgi:GntR family transcriptional repressor for pyruvate dehydrogenase complex